MKVLMLVFVMTMLSYALRSPRRYGPALPSPVPLRYAPALSSPVPPLWDPNRSRADSTVSEESNPTPTPAATVEEPKGSLDDVKKRVKALKERDAQRRDVLRRQKATYEELKTGKGELEESNAALRERLGNMGQAVKKNKAKIQAWKAELQKRLDAMESELREALKNFAMPPRLTLTCEEREEKSKKFVQAANDEKWEEMRTLLADGADVHYKNSEGGGEGDITALHWAAWKENVEALQWLIYCGAAADMQKQNIRGNTPLHNTAYKDYPAATQVLVAKGADIDARNNDMRTPLQDAARENFLRAVQVLLALRANPTLKDKDGKTARDLTTSDEIRALLPA